MRTLTEVGNTILLMLTTGRLRLLKCAAIRTFGTLKNSLGPRLPMTSETVNPKPWLSWPTDPMQAVDAKELHYLTSQETVTKLLIDARKFFCSVAEKELPCRNTAVLLAGRRH
jgi:hypothetical protein